VKYCIFTVSVILLGVIAYYWGFNTANHSYIQNQHQTEEEIPIKTKAEDIPTQTLPDTNSSSPYLYYLTEDSGYVSIYETDKNTIYEYTDIPLQELPLELQKELKAGIGIASERELYDFLENYSS